MKLHSLWIVVPSLLLAILVWGISDLQAGLITVRAGVPQPDTRQHRPDELLPATTTTVFLPVAAKSVMGHSLFGVQMLGEERSPLFLRLAWQAGARQVRLYLLWSEIEPTNVSPVNYHWSRYDTLFADLAAAGLKPLVTIDGNPTWASSRGNGPLDRAPVSEMVEFVDALVRRYSLPPYNVHHWQLYNEPDHWRFWGGQGGAYAALLQALYPVIHAADPAARLILGGLAYDWWDSAPNYVDRAFLDEVVAAGGHTAFDTLAFHYYDRLAWKWTPPNIVGKAHALLSKLPTPKPVVITEMGEPYTGESQVPPYSHTAVANFIIRGHVMALSLISSGINLQGIIWFTHRDCFDGTRHFGLVSPEGQPYPAYIAYSTLSRELAEAQDVGTVSGAAGVTGRRLRLPGRPGVPVDVVWSDEDTGHIFSWLGKVLRVVTPTGEIIWVSDGDPNDRNPQPGWIGLSLSSQPLIVTVEVR